jgi:PAS domain-containing protein
MDGDGRQEQPLTGDVAEHMDRLLAAINDPMAIVYVRNAEGRYVWVSDSYGEQLPYSREQVIGRTNRELHGAAAMNWEVADAFARGSNDFITTAEDMYDSRPGFRRWRKFVSTKLVAKIDGEPYLCGISVEVRDSHAQLYEQRLGQLRARLMERMGLDDDS